MFRSLVRHRLQRTPNLLRNFASLTAQRDNVKIKLSDYTSLPYLVAHVKLDFQLGHEQTRVSNLTTYQYRQQQKQQLPNLVLSGHPSVQLENVRINGKLLARDQEYILTTAEKDGALTIPASRLKDLIGSDGEFQVEILTTVNPSTNTALEGLYVGDGEILVTQCEAEGFRRVTFALDRPDVTAPYDVVLRGNRQMFPIMLSNGNLQSDNGVDSIVHWHDPYHKPSDLFAIVAGDLIEISDTYVTEASGKAVSLRLLYPRRGTGCQHRSDDMLLHALESLKRSMLWDERRFGLEMDANIYHIVAVDNFNAGAMENKTLNVFNSKYLLARPDIATDSDFANVERVVAHEYFHNWTGNRVTLRDWFQLTLKEGLTVFRDQEFSADSAAFGDNMKGSMPRGGDILELSHEFQASQSSARALQRIADVSALHAVQFTEDAGPRSHPLRPAEYEEVQNFFTATVYLKGAEVIRMLQTMYGIPAFNKALQQYIRDNDGRSATVEDWLAPFQNQCGLDVERFGRWYTQKGTPQVRYDLEQDGTNSVRLNITQEAPAVNPEAEPYLFPLSFGLLHRETGESIPVEIEGSDGGGNGALETHTVTVQDGAMSVKLKRANGQSLRTDEVLVSVNRSFSSPVLIKERQSNTGTEQLEDLSVIARCDPDMFKQWDATQQLWSSITQELSPQITPLLSVNPSMALNIHAVPSDVVEAVPKSIIDVVSSHLRRLLEDRAPNKEHPSGPLAEFVASLLSAPPQATIASTSSSPTDPVAQQIATQAIGKAIALTCNEELRAILDSLGSVSRPHLAGASMAGKKPCEWHRDGRGWRAIVNAALKLLIEAHPREDGLKSIAMERSKNMGPGKENLSVRLGAMTAMQNVDGQMRDQMLSDFIHDYEHDRSMVGKWLAVQASSIMPSSVHNVHELRYQRAFDPKNPNLVLSLLGTFANNPAVLHGSPEGQGHDFLVDQILYLDPINPMMSARLAQSLLPWKHYVPVVAENMKNGLRTLQDHGKLSSNLHEIVTAGLRDE
eukprot:Clim_evm29s211 gene=Clim_evmTU29s211